MTTDVDREIYVLLQPELQNVAKVNGVKERILNYVL
jgi:hypothetical protein